MLIIVPPFVTNKIPEQNIVVEHNPLRIWQGKSAGYIIDWTSKNITARKQDCAEVEKVFDLESCVDSVFEQHRLNLIEETGNVGQCNLATYYKIVSVVGHYLCLQEQFLGVYEATKSFSQKTFRTIDLAKAAEQSQSSHSLRDYEIVLTDIFSEQTIIAAFLNNPHIQQALRAKDVTLPNDNLRSLEDFANIMRKHHIFIEDAAGNRNYNFDIDLSNFIIHHSAGGMGIRVLLPNPSILADIPLQLDLNIPSPQNLQSALEKADTKVEGFLMNKRNPVLKETTTMFRRTLFPPYHEFTRL